MGPSGWRKSGPRGPAEWSLLVATLRGPVEWTVCTTLRRTSVMETACSYAQRDQWNGHCSYTQRDQKNGHCLCYTQGTSRMDTVLHSMWEPGNKVKPSGRTEIAFNCLALDDERIFQKLLVWVFLHMYQQLFQLLNCRMVWQVTLSLNTSIYLLPVAT